MNEEDGPRRSARLRTIPQQQQRKFLSDSSSDSEQDLPQQQQNSKFIDNDEYLTSSHSTDDSSSSSSSDSSSDLFDSPKKQTAVKHQRNKRYSQVVLLEDDDDNDNTSMTKPPPKQPTTRSKPSGTTKQRTTNTKTKQSAPTSKPEVISLSSTSDEEYNPNDDNPRKKQKTTITLGKHPQGNTKNKTNNTKNKRTLDIYDPLWNFDEEFGLGLTEQQLAEHQQALLQHAGGSSSTNSGNRKPTGTLSLTSKKTTTSTTSKKNGTNNKKVVTTMVIQQHRNYSVSNDLFEELNAEEELLKQALQEVNDEVAMISPTNHSKYGNGYQDSASSSQTDSDDNNNNGNENNNTSKDDPIQNELLRKKRWCSWDGSNPIPDDPTDPRCFVICYGLVHRPDIHRQQNVKIELRGKPFYNENLKQSNDIDFIAYHSAIKQGIPDDEVVKLLFPNQNNLNSNNNDGDMLQPTANFGSASSQQASQHQQQQSQCVNNDMNPFFAENFDFDYNNTYEDNPFLMNDNDNNNWSQLVSYGGTQQQPGSQIAQQQHNMQHSSNNNTQQNNKQPSNNNNNTDQNEQERDLPQVFGHDYVARWMRQNNINNNNNKTGLYGNKMNNNKTNTNSTIPSTSSKTNNTNNNNDDDEIEITGYHIDRNHPSIFVHHPRYDCRVVKGEHHLMYCANCTCSICRAPATQCGDWLTHGNILQYAKKKENTTVENETTAASKTNTTNITEKNKTWEYFAKQRKEFLYMLIYLLNMSLLPSQQPGKSTDAQQKAMVEYNNNWNRENYPFYPRTIEDNAHVAYSLKHPNTVKGYMATTTTTSSGNGNNNNGHTNNNHKAKNQKTLTAYFAQNRK